MEFRLLGPVEAWTGEELVTLGGPKPQALVGALLVERGRVVSTGHLTSAVWGDDPPNTARALVQTYVAALRRSLGQHGLREALVTSPPGYLLRVPAGAVDRDRFEALLRDGRRCAAERRAAEAGEHLRAALELWRGPAFGDLDSGFFAAEAARLNELRLVATEERAAADLAVGRLDEVCGELAALVEQNPTRERLRGHLMVALYRLGRQADALAVYRQGRQVLVEELGIEPGRQLQAIHRAILTCDPSLLDPLDSLSPGRRPPARPLPRPAELPPVPADFVGRAGELAAVTAALAARPDRVAVPVHVVAGMGGAGKTTLAARAAAALASQYPDGQLYAELHGMSGSPAHAVDVLGGFLRALGAEPATLAETASERAGQFRTRVAGRRMLIVLDDAHSERQVRPLLPGAPTCAVLVTARGRLAGLAGATRTELDVLDHAGAMELLSRVVGDDRPVLEAGAARLIVDRCAHLPLAIRLAGARLAARRNWSLDLLADRLADEHRRLDELAAGDQDVRSSIGPSYEALGERDRCALRRLAVLGLSHFPAWILGALLGVAAAESDLAVEQLVDAQLLSVVGVDVVGQVWYRMHDLVRIFGRERAAAEEPLADLRAALGQVFTRWFGLADRIAARRPTGELRFRDPPRPLSPVPVDLVPAAVNHLDS